MKYLQLHRNGNLHFFVLGKIQNKKNREKTKQQIEITTNDWQLRLFCSTSLR